METILDALLGAAPVEDKIIMLGTQVFRRKLTANGSAWEDVTPPSGKQAVEIDLFHDLLGKPVQAHSLMEFLSSKMVKLYTISVYVKELDDKTGYPWMKLLWTTGTPEMIEAMLGNMIHSGKETI